MIDHQDTYILFFSAMKWIILKYWSQSYYINEILFINELYCMSLPWKACEWILITDEVITLKGGYVSWSDSALNHTSWFSVPLSGFWLQDTDWGHQTSNCSRLRLLETFCKWDWRQGGLCFVTAAGDTFSYLEASQYRLMWRRREGWWRMYWRDGQSSDQNVEDAEKQEENAIQRVCGLYR